MFIKCLTPVFRYPSADLLDPALAGHAECKSVRKQRLSLSLYGCESSEVSLAQEEDCLGLSSVCRHIARESRAGIYSGVKNQRRKGETLLHPELFFSPSLSLWTQTWAKWFFRNHSDCDVSISHLPLVEHRLKKNTVRRKKKTRFSGKVEIFISEFSVFFLLL